MFILVLYGFKMFIYLLGFDIVFVVLDNIAFIVSYVWVVNLFYMFASSSALLFCMNFMMFMGKDVNVMVVKYVKVGDYIVVIFMLLENVVIIGGIIGG